MKRDKTWVKMGLMFLLTVGGTMFSLVGVGLAEKEVAEKQKEVLKEKAKKAGEEAAQRTEMERARQKQLEEIRIQREKILKEQKGLVETFERNRFVSLAVKLPKSVYEVGEKIAPEFSIRNGSNRLFYIDGRKSYPKVEVWDKKGTEVSIHQSAQELPLPQEKDMVVLKPGETFVPTPVDFTMEKPGSYTMRLVYPLMAPEKKMDGVWFGTINTYSIGFKVAEKKVRK